MFTIDRIPRGLNGTSNFILEINDLLPLRRVSVLMTATEMERMGICSRI